MVIVEKLFFTTIITNVGSKCGDQGPPPHRGIIFTNNNFITGTKTTKSIRFPKPKQKTRACLITNIDRETRKTRTRR